MLNSQIFKKLTNRAKKSLYSAAEIAKYHESESISPEHLFLAIFLEKGSTGQSILNNLGIIKDQFEPILIPKKKKRKKTNKKIDFNSKNIFSTSSKKIITKAYSLASSFNYPYVGTEHLTYALIESNDKGVQKILSKNKNNNAAKKKNLAKQFINVGNPQKATPNLIKMFDLPEIAPATSPLPLEEDIYPDTPHLDNFCVDVTQEVQEKTETLIGRNRELKRMSQILGRKNKNNPLLLGSPGVGKTALVNALAQKINQGQVPFYLINQRIFRLDMATVVAGTSFRGEFEARLKGVIREVEEFDNIILFIDEIHNIVGAGSASGSLDAANILKPSLSSSSLQCIGATTLDEYKKYIEKDPALNRRFQPILISEPSFRETEKIITGAKGDYEKFHKLSISPESVKKAIDLGIRYLPDRYLPDKIFDIIDETASRKRSAGISAEILKEIHLIEKELDKIAIFKSRLVNNEDYEKAMQIKVKEDNFRQKLKEAKVKQQILDKKKLVEIEPMDIEKTVAQMTQISLSKIQAQTSQKIARLEQKLEKQILGQKEALNKIGKSIIRSHSGFSDPDRPLASFLFLGPTGVGKTLTAKILAQELFDKKDSLIRVDMSEFMEKHNVAKLIGAPAGYVGYGEGGNLTEKIRHNPYSVVLFDEIEKAHPEVWNLLLQVLEDGILTDGEGQTVNFKNTIIILTSNLGTHEFTNSAKIGFSNKLSSGNQAQEFNSIKENILDNLKKQMKPEFLNRLDHIVVFNALFGKNLEKIVELELEKLKKRIKERNIELSYSKKLLPFVTQKSLSFDQGARLVRKNIQELVEDELAKFLLRYKNPPAKVGLDIKKNKLAIAKSL